MGIPDKGESDVVGVGVGVGVGERVGDGDGVGDGVGVGAGVGAGDGEGEDRGIGDGEGVRSVIAGVFVTAGGFVVGCVGNGAAMVLAAEDLVLCASVGGMGTLDANCVGVGDVSKTLADAGCSDEDTKSLLHAVNKVASALLANAEHRRRLEIDTELLSCC